MQTKKITITDLHNKKKNKQPITMLTAYDFPFASIIDEQGIDIVLIGDSLGMVVLGHDNTLSVTMDEMIHHCKAVSNAVNHAFVIGDMPFMSYQASNEDAVKNAGRFIKEGKVDAVKMEGNARFIEKIKAVSDVGISVMGHIGLTPQSATQLGGYKVQGKTAGLAEDIINDAIKLANAGCFALIIECVPDKISEIISTEVDIPCIGIGAGPGCDGQVLVAHDVLGLYKKFTPKFAKQYIDLSNLASNAIKQYKEDVEQRKFPSRQHSFTIDEKEIPKIKIKK